MDLEKVTAKIRPRKSWEAIDLGIVLVQKHWKALYQIWLITSLPLFLMFTPLYFVFGEWSFLFFWLIKPLLERPLLYFISRVLFGEQLSVKQCSKAFFSLAAKQWFASLTWRRFSFTRSFDLPIIQLEGLKATDRSNRIKVIHSKGSGASVWLTIVFFITEVIFIPLAFIGLIYLFIPPEIVDDKDMSLWLFNDDTGFWMETLISFFSYIGMTIIAPFYVICGFSLYINQRTLLEAWDIELTFKSLAKRLKEKSEYQVTRLANIFLMIGLISCLSFMPTQPLLAAKKDFNQDEKINQQIEKSLEKKGDKLTKNKEINEIETEDKKKELSEHEKVRQEVKKIFEGKDFHNKVKDYKYQYIHEKPEKETTRKNLDGFYWIGKIISILVEFALWVFVALLIIFLCIRYRHLITGYRPKNKTKRNRPKKLFGLDLESDSLPEKPWSVALDFAEQEKFREALSLLYRASLIWYIDNTSIKIREGDTELECLNKTLKYSDKDQKDLMSEITTNWRNLAYAHQIPDKNEIKSLCQRWPSILKLQQPEDTIQVNKTNGVVQSG